MFQLKKKIYIYIYIYIFVPERTNYDEIIPDF